MDEYVSMFIKVKKTLYKKLQYDRRKKTMENALLKAIKEYKERHPEIDEIMKKFQMTQEAYDRALASIGIRVQRTGPTYTLTTGGRYNANISKST